MIKVKVTLLLLLFTTVSGFSQSQLAQNLAKITQAYMSAKVFSADVTVLGYKTRQDINGILIGNGMIRKSNENYYSRFKDDEMISNKKCMLIVDHYGKNVKYFDSKDIAKSPSALQMPKMDSMLKKNDSVSYKGIQNGEEHYVFYKAKSAITRTDIYVSATSHFIKSIVYYYTTSKADGDYGMYKVVITYDNIKLQNVDNTWFSEKKYIDQKNGKPVLQTAYSNYKLIVADKFKPL